MSPLFSWPFPYGRSGGRSSELSVLRRDLQADRERLAVNLHMGKEQLQSLAQWVDRASIDRLLLAHKALITIVERENFTTMRAERIPVVIAQVTTRLDRLGKMLRESAERVEPIRSGFTERQYEKSTESQSLLRSANAPSPS